MVVAGPLGESITNVDASSLQHCGQFRLQRLHLQRTDHRPDRPYGRGCNRQPPYAKAKQCHSFQRAPTHFATHTHGNCVLATRLYAAIKEKKDGDAEPIITFREFRMRAVRRSEEHTYTLHA